MNTKLLTSILQCSNELITSDVPPFVSKQAISKARQGISYKPFLELFRLSVKQFYFLSTNLRTWNDFHIYAIDGSTIQIPESKENYEISCQKHLKSNIGTGRYFIHLSRFSQ